ncbi:TMEM175 family protein [Limosilactobacillus sp.]|uniref:TMEM175 family protein n=1 Tax=Limosilactobacillus sp. TaxID=2773925 RepID=UPI00345E1C1C
MNKERLAAFTDAIVAIAATIMVLELHVPKFSTFASFWDERSTFIAYIISFFLIYTVWYNHHNLFEKAKHITPRIFLVNGFWLFIVTLIPFTTAWVGSDPNSFAPEFLYSFVLLLWSITFHLLDVQIIHDNPHAQPDESTRLVYRSVLYGLYIVSIILSFIKPVLAISLIGIGTVVLTIVTFTSAVKE